MLKTALIPSMTRQETFLFQFYRNVKSPFVVLQEKLFFQFFRYCQQQVVCCVSINAEIGDSNSYFKLGSFAHTHTSGYVPLLTFCSGENLTAVSVKILYIETFVEVAKTAWIFTFNWKPHTGYRCGSVSLTWLQSPAPSPHTLKLRFFLYAQ